MKDHVRQIARRIGECAMGDRQLDRLDRTVNGEPLARQSVRGPLHPPNGADRTRRFRCYVSRGGRGGVLLARSAAACSERFTFRGLTAGDDSHSMTHDELRHYAPRGGDGGREANKTIPRRFAQIQRVFFRKKTDPLVAITK